jgi:enamine deaminase RidA (YjgF/YER057c/UK114 family)
MSYCLKSLLAIILICPAIAWAENQGKTVAAVAATVTAVEPKNLVFIRGQRTGDVEVPDPNGAAIKQAFDQIRQIAEKNGATMDDIVQVTIYLADYQHDYPFIHGIVQGYFTNPQNVARSIVGVVSNPDDGINRRVQVEAILAVKPKQS